MYHSRLIQSFAAHMLSQMDANDARNGNTGQYQPAKNINTVDPEALRAMFNELRRNVDALENAVLNDGFPQSPGDQVADTVAFAADVANMAMLVAYDAGALTPMPGPVVPDPESTRAAFEKATSQPLDSPLRRNGYDRPDTFHFDPADGKRIEQVNEK